MRKESMILNRLISVMGSWEQLDKKRTCKDCLIVEEILKIAKECGYFEKD